MKNLAVLALTVLMVGMISSCKKDYTCTHEDAEIAVDGSDSLSTVTVFEGVTKEHLEELEESGWSCEEN